MASKWLDPGGGWTVADWEDSTQTVLMSHLWDALKGAADERVAFARLIHDSSFAAADTFPDFNTAMSIFLANANTPNNATRIKNAIYPEDCVKTSDINSSGTDTTIPDSLTLSEVLTEPLGYPSGNLLHMTDTSSGSQTGLSLMTWVKQWFQVMDYPEYYWRPFLTSTGGADEAWITDLQVQNIVVDIVYKYNKSTSTFISCVCNVTDEDGGPTDVYTGGDLNESAPWSTPQEVRDYAVGKLNSSLSTDSFSANQNNLSGLTFGTLKPNSAYCKVKETVFPHAVIGAGPDYEVRIEGSYISDRFRFKLADHKRATSPNEYTCPIQINYSWQKGLNDTFGTYDDFGTGKTEGNVELDTLTPDGSGWYLVEIDAPDYNNTTALTVQTSGPPWNIARNHVGLYQWPISPGGKGGSTLTNGYYVKPNQSDGSAWEYYTP